MTESRPFRVLPKVSALTEHYWKGGADGRLHLLRCQDCQAWVHPPAPVCHVCLSKNVVAEAVSGRGSVFAATVNHKAWNPTMPDRYAIAMVELDEGVRIFTNIVDVDPDQVVIGMPVEVVFEQHDEVYLPMFRPARNGS